MMNLITTHSCVQHAVNTIGTQHSTSSQVVIPQPQVSVHQPIATINQYVGIVLQSMVMVQCQPQSV